MRISDWSSDVCSSDLYVRIKLAIAERAVVLLRQRIQAILQGVCPAYDRTARIDNEAPGSVQARQDGLRHGATAMTAMAGRAVPIEALLRVYQVRWIGQCAIDGPPSPFNALPTFRAAQPRVWHPASQM